MPLLVLTHLFHSFLGYCSFRPSFLTDSFSILFQKKKKKGTPRVGPWKVKEVGKWMKWGRILLNILSEDRLFRLLRRGAPWPFCSQWSICGLFALLRRGFVLVCFSFFILDRFLHATKRSSELHLPRTLSMGSDYTNKY